MVVVLRRAALTKAAITKIINRGIRVAQKKRERRASVARHHMDVAGGGSVCCGPEVAGSNPVTDAIQFTKQFGRCG